MLLDSCNCDLPVIWVTLVTQPMCLNLTQLLIVSLPKDHHTHQIYNCWVRVLCTEFFLNWITQHYIQLDDINLCYTLVHGTINIGGRSDPLQSRVNESHWLDLARHNAFTESHSQYSLKLTFKVTRPFTESPTLLRLQFGSILGGK